MLMVRIRKFEGFFRIYIVNEDNNEYIIDNLFFMEKDLAEKHCLDNEFRIVDENYNPMDMQWFNFQLK